MLFVVCCFLLLLAERCSVFVACSPLYVVCCLSVARCLMFVGGSLPFVGVFWCLEGVVCYVLVGYGSLFVVRYCLLFDDCCFLFEFSVLLLRMSCLVCCV